MSSPSCSGCGHVKPLSKFMGESEEVREGQDLSEIVEPNDLFDYIIQLLEAYSMQQGSSSENVVPFFFECSIDIAVFEKISKEITDELIDIIEEADEFAWIYNHSYQGIHAVTYRYVCSQ
ncbi:hypothetical protein F8M41_026353 [Gigaspora margarita]|uniref:Uncharacterized protein n=1 Tax=Gigaspora margarita TaxID=4874 RepID=A0A8H4ESU2_GIGMA|nr:hypothetical protein F8M41_026353 [Gigaspora margarita]